MNLADRTREIFESSEVDGKRQLLNLVFQNLQLEDASLSVSVRELFLMMMDFKKCPKGWGRLDSNQRKPKLGDLQSPAIATMRHPLKRKGTKKKKCWQKDLNPQPSAYKADALPLSYTSTKEVNSIAFC